MNLNEEISNAYPTFPSGQGAKQAVAQAIAARGTVVRRARRVRRSFVFGTITVASIFALTSVGPRALGFYRLRQIEGSVSDAKTADFEVTYLSADGTPTHLDRTYYDRGKWRIQRGTGYTIWKAGVQWSYEPELHRATYQASASPASNQASGFSIRSMVSDMANWQWRDQVTLSEEQFEGRMVTRLTIENPNGAERTIFLADKDTDMPIASWLEVKSARGWLIRGTGRSRFDQPVDPKLFDTRFGPDVQVIDLDRSKARFVAAIQHPLATMPWNGRTAAIRWLDVNPNGDVFIFYTDGETQTERQRQSDAELAVVRSGKPGMLNFRMYPHLDLSVTDSRGNQYVRSMMLQPFMAGPSGFRSGVVLADGETLQGLWLIPKQASVWRPLTLTLSVSGTTGALYRKTFESPSCPLVPDWAPLMGMAPKRDGDILREELSQRRPFIEDRHDPAALIANVQAELDLRLKEEREGIGPWAKGDLYLKLYQAYSQLGDRDSALANLRLGDDEPYPTPELEKALAKEGIR